MDQIELDIAAPAVQLPLALGFGPWRVLAPLKNGRVRLEKPISDTLHESKRPLKAPFVEVVVEQAPYPSRLLTMRQIKIIVTPFFEPGVGVLTKGVTSGLRRLVPMNRVLFISVIGREVEPTPHPPHRFFARLFRHKHADVGMGGRCMGVAGMNHQRHAHGSKASPGQLRPVLCCRRRHARTHHMGEVDATFLNDLSFRQHAADAATALRTIPGLGSEGLPAIDLLKSGANLCLQ